MSKISVFSLRVTKEILRDPLSIAFGVGFPIVLIVLLSTINKNIPNNMFDIQLLTPGVAVFGLSFLALFAAQIIAKDRESAFIIRLFTTPIKPIHFILGYTLPLIPLALIQGIISYISGVIFGLQINFDTLISLLLLIPISLIFIGIGLLSGTLFSEKAATALCGALLTNLSAWLSGIWFDLNLVGGLFKSIAYVLPFVHAVDLIKAATIGDYNQILPHLWWVLGYGLFLLTFGIFFFNRFMVRR